MTNTFIKSAIIFGAVTALVPGVVFGDELPKKGSTSYTTHYVFSPMGYNTVEGVGRVVPLRLYGTTTNTKGEATFDKMDAKCFAIKVEAGDKSYIDGACSMTDADGHAVFSTFDTRELDKSQPKMDCGTHFIIGGTGKYKGITGTEPFACIFAKDNPVGGPFADYRVETPHNVTWEIK
ncbi:MAG: hypothetical protein ACR2OF_07265 [Hyphomicrobium sp.]